MGADSPICIAGLRLRSWACLWLFHWRARLHLRLGCRGNIRFWVHFHSGPHLLHASNDHLFSDLDWSHHNLHVSLGGTELHRNRLNDVVRTEDYNEIISLNFDGGGLRNDEGILVPALARLCEQTVQAGAFRHRWEKVP